MNLQLATALVGPWVVNGVSYQVCHSFGPGDRPRFHAKLWESGAPLSGGIDGMPNDSFAVNGASGEHQQVLGTIAARLRSLGAFV